MLTIYSLLTVMHLLGLALGVGSATVKLILLFRCNSNYDFMPVYFSVTKHITRLIVLGLILLTLSVIGWLFIGYSFTPLLIVKVVLVGLVWVLGPIIDNVAEPRVKKLIPLQGDTASLAFIHIQKQYLVLELTATLLMYAITILGAML